MLVPRRASGGSTSRAHLRVQVRAWRPPTGRRYAGRRATGERATVSVARPSRSTPSSSGVQRTTQKSPRYGRTSTTTSSRPSAATPKRCAAGASSWTGTAL